MSAVIYDFARTRDSSCLKEIDAQSVSAEHAVLRTYSIAVKILYTAFGDVVLRKSCDEFGVDSIIGE